MRLPRAVAYLRCSTDKQPLSLEDQRRTIGRWADPRGVRVIRWYADEAMSGASASDRDGFQSMVQELEKQRDADLVLCYDISRFGRTDNDEAGYYRYRIRQAGAEVVYVAESAVTGGETDELLVPILQYQKREQLRALSRDTLRGTMGLAARGAWCGGPAPFGYTREVRAQDGTPSGASGPESAPTTRTGPRCSSSRATASRSKRSASPGTSAIWSGRATTRSGTGSRSSASRRGARRPGGARRSACCS